MSADARLGDLARFLTYLNGCGIALCSLKDNRYWLPTIWDTSRWAVEYIRTHPVPDAAPRDAYDDLNARFVDRVCSSVDNYNEDVIAVGELTESVRESVTWYERELRAVVRASKTPED